MRFLILSICFLMLACGSYPKKHQFTKTSVKPNTIKNLYFANTEIDYVYKAKIAVYNKTFGGIFIVKKIEDNQHRIAFTTEMGNKLFDFSFKENEFQVNYILEELNKKFLINILKTDFKALITETLPVESAYKVDKLLIFKTTLDNRDHYYYRATNLKKIVRTKGKKEKVTVSFQNINNNFAQQIDIKHTNIKLHINLKSIN